MLLSDLSYASSDSDTDTETVTSASSAEISQSDSEEDGLSSPVRDEKSVFDRISFQDDESDEEEDEEEDEDEDEQEEDEEDKDEFTFFKDPTSTLATAASARSSRSSSSAIPTRDASQMNMSKPHSSEKAGKKVCVLIVSFNPRWFLFVSYLLSYKAKLRIA